MKKTNSRRVTVQARVTKEAKRVYELYCKSIETTVSDHLYEYVQKVISDNSKSNIKD